MLTFTIQFTKADLYHAFLWASRRVMWIFGIVSVLATVPISRGLLPGMWDADVETVTVVRVTVTTLLGCLLFTSAVIALPLSLQVRRASRQPGFGESTNYTFSADGVKSENPHSAFQVTWALTKGASENDEFVFLNLTAGGFFFFPKRCLDDANLAALRGVLRDHLQARARLR